MLSFASKSETLKIHIKTLHNLEKELAKEVEAIGGKNIEIKKRALNCEGDLEFLYKANLNLRTAIKVLVPVYNFKAKNEKELYDEVMKHDWSQYLGEHDAMAIDHTINSEFFKHSQYASLKIKDAIVDQFRNRTKYRPNIDVKYPDVKFDVYAYNDWFTISLDSSGDPLNRRGYREQGHKAPLNEALAAGMVLKSGWDGQSPLLDPMCGSGTILIEAALYALNVPPQILRKEFGFKRWKNFQPTLWSRVQSDAERKVKRHKLMIYGGDIDAYAVKLASKSLRKLRLGNQVKVSQADFLSSKPIFTQGTIITNPPYGERLEKEDINAYYKEMSDVLKNNYPGYEIWILSSNLEALKSFKLSPTQKTKLFNGKLDCSYEHYRLY
jgi:putative N6-adenine-specific DNA methylase